MNSYCTVVSIGRNNQTQLVALLVIGKFLLLIFRCKVLFLWQNPYLQEMDRGVSRRIGFAMSHAGAGAHTLRITATNNRSVAHAVAMFQSAFQNISNYFHVAMPMGRKSMFRLHEVFIDHTQATKSHVLRIVILIKGESVIGVEPAEIEVTALLCFANRDHGVPCLEFNLQVVAFGSTQAKA